MKVYTIYDRSTDREIFDRIGKPFHTKSGAKIVIGTMIREVQQYPWRKGPASDDPKDYDIRTYKLSWVCTEYYKSEA